MARSAASVMVRQRAKEEQYRKNKTNVVLGDGGTGSSPDPEIVGTTFVELSDTPGNYSGKAGELASVKSTESGLEFIGSLELDYYEPLTDGDTTAPEILFDGDGDVLMAPVEV